MKKVWLFATAALALGTGCSKDNVGGIDDSTQQEIVLGAGSAVSVSQAKASRGIGAIGGLEADNKWNGETVYVYGINTSAEGDAQFAINAETANAPKGSASGSLTWATEGTHYYYNGKDVYDFYGVHVDDAVTDVATTMKIGKGVDLVKAGFAVDATINGTQDLMVAVPNKAADIEAADNPELTGQEKSLYSAWSSRRNVKPNLVFNHLLSRLNFQAKCGSATIPGTEPDAKDQIKITKIEILDVYNQGKLQIIPVESKPQGFTPTAKNPDTKVNFTVKSKGADGALEELTPVPVITSELTSVGEDILLYPEQSFNVLIYTEQDKDESETIEENEKDILPWTITLPESKPFEAGAMYDINITVYGLEEIEINATLTAWQDGGDVDLDPDDIPMPDPQP